MPLAGMIADGADQILGAPLPERACGGCTLCCVLPEINVAELKKAAGVTCQHCTGGGCGIYPERPNICRTWHCVWRRVPEMPEAARPDRISVMFELAQPAAPRSPLHKLYIRGVALHSWDDFSHPLVLDALAYLRTKPIPVWLSYGDSMTLAHPSFDVGRCLVENAPAPSEAVAREAKRWRERYEKT